jgi:DNA-binding transcriptional ArsR family regulator
MDAPTRPRKKAGRRSAPDHVDFHRVAERLKQVSDLTRLNVLLLLGDRERSVGDLRAEIACSMTAISRHLTLLRLAGIVIPRRDGQRNVYALTEEGQGLHRVIMGVIG